MRSRLCFRGVAVAAAWKTGRLSALWVKNAARPSRAGGRHAVSFEDFVNGGKECLRNCQAESRRRLDVDGKFELGRLLDWNIARFCAAQNLVHHFGGLSEQIGVVRSIRHQTTYCDIVVIAHHCW